MINEFLTDFKQFTKINTIGYLNLAARVGFEPTDRISRSTD